MNRRIIAFILAGFFGHLAAAQAQIIRDSHSGWYNDDGHHEVGNSDYFVQARTHDYFVFDLTHVRSPITRASLSLQLPTLGYGSSQPSSTFELVGLCGFSSSVLDNNEGGVAAYEALSNGPVLGETQVALTFENSSVWIDLSSGPALDFLNQHLGTEVLFGGYGPDLINSEYLFGFTYAPYVNGPGAALDISTLSDVTPVPEPATYGISALTLLLFLVAQRYRAPRRTWQP